MAGVRLSVDPTDVGAVAMQTLVQHRPGGTALPTEIRAFGPVLARAGLLAVS